MATDIEFSGGPSIAGATVVSSPYTLTSNLGGGWVDFTGTNETLAIAPTALAGSQASPSTLLISGEVYNFAPGDAVILDNISEQLSIIGSGTVASALPILFGIDSAPVLTLAPGTTSLGSVNGVAVYGTLTTNSALFNGSEPPNSATALEAAEALNIIEKQTAGSIVSDSPIGVGPTLFLRLSDVGGIYYGTLTTSAELNIDPKPCFVTGTRILTSAGEVAVENLAEGDLAATASGALRPIKWIGRRTLSLTKHPRPETICPVRIAAGALADGIPCRDLIVSPDHALLLDGALVQAKDLVDGVLVTHDFSRTHITYWHIELDSHDALIAEGAAAESFLDTGHRGFFENAGEPVTLHPDLMQERRESGSFAPLVTAGKKLTAIRKKLAARLRHLGYAPAENQILVRADNKIIAPVFIRHGKLSFTLPAGAQNITLHSGHFVPAELNAKSNDRRALGLAIRKLRFAGKTVAVEDVIHPSSLHPRAEGDKTVWTRGNVKLNLPATGGILELEYRAIAAHWQRAA